MKRYMWIWLLVTMVIMAAIWGGSQKGSYTDICGEENYEDLLVVAEMPEKLAVFACEDLGILLPDAPVVLKVSVVDDIEYFFMSARQKVCVEEVFVGNEDLLGQEIYLTCLRWKLSLFYEPKSMERGFVNIMKTGEEYLVFSDGIVEGLNEDIPVYKLMEQSLIATIFCYADKENIVVPVREGGDTYVKYSTVKENEFFGATEAAVKAWEDLKTQVMAWYAYE